MGWKEQGKRSVVGKPNNLNCGMNGIPFGGSCPVLLLDPVVIE